MTPSPAAERAASSRGGQTAQGEERGYWPFDVSHAPELTIGDAVARLKTEFPALKVSKLRYLEEHGMVTPHRTGAGYRKYSEADIARVRYVLQVQRDTYTPLDQIRDVHLRALDAGLKTEAGRVARVVASEGELVRPAPNDQITMETLEDLTGAHIDQIEEYLAAGLLETDSRGFLTGRNVDVVSALMELGHHGISTRNLMPLRRAAENAAGVIESAVSSRRAQNSGVAQERANALAAALGECYARLFTALLRDEIAR
ncbi:MAG: MerR family transcriptional regulator [Buchananella hordeovulneris]|nr:MerR family transcriptional regulator [Buchananella hordeovulneris]